RRERATRPRVPEVGQVPALSHQTVETARVSEDGLDGIVGQIMKGEEASLLAVLTLPCDRAVRSQTAQRSRPVALLLDADEEVVLMRMRRSFISRILVAAG